MATKIKNIDDDVLKANSQWAQFKRNFDNGHSTFVKNARKYDDFYRGKQWAEEDEKKLRESKRPALTLNMVLPTVNTVLGEQINTRVDIAFKPKRTGTQAIADALSKIAMQVRDNNNFQWQETQVFQDGLITGRGFYDVRIDFEQDVRGEVKIRSLDPSEVVLDIEGKDYDPATWRQVFTYSWQTLDDIEQTYGKKYADKLRFLGMNSQHYGRDSMVMDEVRDTFGDTDSTLDHYNVDHEEAEKTVRSIRVVERQHRMAHMQKFFVDYRTGDTSPIPESWDEEKTLQVQSQFGLGIIKKMGSKIRWTITADSVVLYDEWSLYDDFTIVPYFAYFRRGKPFGLVENLVSSQEQLNKTASQELHIVNTTANSGWTYEDGTLINMDEHELAQRGAETGLILVHARGTNPPQKIQPNQIPSGLDNISKKANNHIRQISGVNDAMLGDSRADVSGVAIQEKQARGQVQIQVPLDNLAKTRTLVGNRILKLVQQFYTEERVYRITNETRPELGEEELVVNEMAPDGSILNDLTIGKYDVVITTLPSRDTYDETQFANALQMREMGVMVPDHIIIEHSSLERKHEIAELMKQMGGFMPPSEEEQKMMQWQQEMQMKSVELELGKLESELGEIQARAQLQMSKAEQISREDELKVADLQSKIGLKREEMQMRIQLALLSSQNQKNATGAKMLMESARLDTQKAVAQMQVAAKSKEKPQPQRGKA